MSVKITQYIIREPSDKLDFSDFKGEQLWSDKEECENWIAYLNKAGDSSNLIIVPVTLIIGGES